MTNKPAPQKASQLDMAHEARRAYLKSSQVSIDLLAPQAVSRSEVVSAYRAILDRDPESEAAIGWWVGHGSLEAIISGLIESDEFKSKSGPPTVEVHLCNGIPIAFHHNDPMLEAIRGNSLWEQWVHEPCMRLLQPGSKFVDIGANVGIFAVGAALAGADVVAVEMSPENAKLIALNASLNNVGIDIRAVGVSNRSQMLLFARMFGSNKSVNQFARLSLESFNDFEAAPAIDIDELFQEPVDVVKIDIEGYEYSALSEATAIWRQAPYIFAEYSDQYQRDCSGASGLAYLDLFKKAGYQFQIVEHNHSVTNVGDDIEAVNNDHLRKLNAGGFTHTDILAVPPGKPLFEF